MKLRGLIFFLSFLSLGTVGIIGQEPSSAHWREGQRLYAQGRFQDALLQFEQVLTHTDHWRVHYNVGNCLYKLDRFLEAKIAFARAWKTAPWQRSIRNNLSVVNARLGFQDEILKQTLVYKWLGILDGVLYPQLAAVLLIISLFLFNASLFFWLRRHWVRPARYVFVLSLLLIVLLGAYTFHCQTILNRQDLAVVSGQGASLFSGPGEHHTALFSLPKGLIVKVREQGDQWLRVKAGSEVSGWIKPELLTLL